MINLSQMTEQDYEKMAQEINEISQTKSETELLELIGTALHDSGLTVSTSESSEIVQPKMFNENKEKFSVAKSFDFVVKSEPLTQNDAKEEGEKFWYRFKDKLQDVICTDSRIKELITGNGTLKDFIVAGIPLVLAALGLITINPVFLAIIAAVFALILKVGFKAYCELP